MVVPKVFEFSSYITIQNKNCAIFIELSVLEAVNLRYLTLSVF